MAMEAQGRSPPIAGLKTMETNLQRTMWLAVLRWVLAACGSWQNQMLGCRGVFSGYLCPSLPATYPATVSLFIFILTGGVGGVVSNKPERPEWLLSFCVKFYHSTSFSLLHKAIR
jgi:hypothetical protein